MLFEAVRSALVVVYVLLIFVGLYTQSSLDLLSLVSKHVFRFATIINTAFWSLSGQINFVVSSWSLELKLEVDKSIN